MARGVRVAAAATMLAAAVVSPAAAAVGSHRTVGPAQNATGVHYAVLQRLCAAPKPGHAACLAIRRVPVATGARAAVRYVVRPGLKSGPAGGYTPAELQTAYGLTALPATAGAQQTVAVVDAYNDPTAAADLATFDAMYGLPPETATSFRVVGQTGNASVLPSNDTTGWSGEESLDVQAVRAICARCAILLVETNSSSNADLMVGAETAVRLGATEVSNSYGSGESATMSAKRQAAYRAAYTHPGVVMTASAGDDGWFDWDRFLGIDAAVSANAPEIPAALPNVVAVGGTSLLLNTDGTRSSETVWNDNGPEAQAALAQDPIDALGAAGGGCSTRYAAPGWQRNEPGFGAAGCGSKRLVSDVAADADPDTGLDVYASYDCGARCEPVGWQTIGGTSLASPLIAAMWALAGGSGGVADPGLTLYGHAMTDPSGFYDVTSGGNGWCGGDSAATCAAETAQETSPSTSNPNRLSNNDDRFVGLVDCSFTSAGAIVATNTQCNAAPGFDGPTGLGTPTGLGVFAPLHPTAAIQSPARVVAKHAAHFTATTTDPFPGGTIVTYTWRWGDRSTSTGQTVSHKYAGAGTYKVRLTVTDQYGSAATATISLTVR